MADDSCLHEQHVMVTCRKFHQLDATSSPYPHLRALISFTRHKAATYLKQQALFNLLIFTLFFYQPALLLVHICQVGPTGDASGDRQGNGATF